ncbi:MAG: alpha/beta hydrolase [Synergistaceae bacterium]|nr:alpha/beta hydrolase [Synergistaceae bacterium]
MKRFLTQLALVVLLALVSSSALAADITAKQFPLERNGVKLFLQRLQEDGSGDEGQILLIHGLTFSSHEFDLDFKDYSFARYLARQGYSVWTLDIAGYARSAEVSDGFMPDSDYAAEDINAAVDLIASESKASAVDLLGWSWGTVTGGRFAAKYPQKVRKLILYAPIVAGLGYSNVANAFVTEAWKGAPDDFQLDKDGKIDPAITDPGVVDLFNENTKKYDSHPVPNGGRRDLLSSPNSRLIPTALIKNPTLLLVGDKDPYVSVKLVYEALKSIPSDAEIQVFRGGGHALFMEIPHYVGFREAVVDFLKR